MATVDQQTNITNALAALTNAQDLLTQQIDAANDTQTSNDLTNEYNDLDLLRSGLLQAQNAADDASFTNATTTLQSQANDLKADEASIGKIVADVKIAGNIVGYIGQALAFIAKL